MTTAPSRSPAAPDPFDALRGRLFSVAYRMLGTRADAEDIVQDAWLRWQQNTDRAAVQSAEAWLVTIVTRLSIDRLRAAKVEREAYIGWWLPEPLVEAADERTPEAAIELASDLSIALLWVLERLSVEERAAFLLRQVFDHDYDEIAALLGKTEAACRQMVHRASERVQQTRTRFDVPPDAHRRVVEKFVAAAQSGQRDAIQALLAEDVELVGDGGGKVPALSKVLHGAFRIANLFWVTGRRFGSTAVYRHALINGQPGVLRYIDGKLESAMAFATDGERVVGIYAMRNPDKLAHIPQSLS
ncbi:RNA polymerase sigma-70 factor [Trinickia dinghuensis]|uniref:RNA polymerase sigma-70 factor n=1 Tax=Trinickia dinghuensis TaxID=2291023 RepID=A0A3D8K0H9_9BURK|nr:RNA polymerase sigma-70 factor [Trinickia dinghuensis]RDU98630.1 RNA polymerase sigma-70 factor [Trinickia dinghuensis]